MIVQWCIKGISLRSDDEAVEIIDAGQGLVCNWWRKVEDIDPADTRLKLTAQYLDMHVNHFAETDPSTGRPFYENSPFISLSAGTVERDTVAQTNFVHRARKTALYFATEFGRRNLAYLYTCWVILAPRAAVEIEGMAEEVRDLNIFRRYSPYQTEGEVVAKVIIEDNRIQSCEKWELGGSPLRFHRVWTYTNPRFTPPERLTNVRELI